jgi:hypothetical protein
MNRTRLETAIETVSVAIVDIEYEMENSDYKLQGMNLEKIRDGLLIVKDHLIKFNHYSKRIERDYKYYKKMYMRGSE